MSIENVILFQIDKTSKLSKLYSQREFDKVGLGITVEQWILLKIIHESNDSTQRELAEKSFRDPASITRTLDLLDKKGFVQRKSVPNNRRQYSICLTSEGVGFVEKNLSIVETYRAKSIEGLTKEDLRILDEILKKIQQNMT